MGESRVGLGFDTHPRSDERPLMLAGVQFEGEAGLEGHSDADVVCHALADALLGAAALGDLGEHFLEGAPETEDLPGLDLLTRAVALVREAGLRAASCDLVLIAEAPRIAARREEMRANLARALDVPADRVSVKATRPEGMGLTGDGMGCLAIVSLVER